MQQAYIQLVCTKNCVLPEFLWGWASERSWFSLRRPGICACWRSSPVCWSARGWTLCAHGAVVRLCPPRFPHPQRSTHKKLPRSHTPKSSRWFLKLEKKSGNLVRNFARASRPASLDRSEELRALLTWWGAAGWMWRWAQAAVQRPVLRWIRVFSKIRWFRLWLQVTFAKCGGTRLHHAGNVRSAGRRSIRASSLLLGWRGVVVVALGQPVHRKVLHHVRSAARWPVNPPNVRGRVWWPPLSGVSFYSGLELNGNLHM